MNIPTFKSQIKEAGLEARKQRDLEAFDVRREGIKLFSVSYIELFHLTDISPLLQKHGLVVDPQDIERPTDQELAMDYDRWDLEKEKMRLQEIHDAIPGILKELTEMTGIDESQLLRLAVHTARNEHPVKWYEVLSILRTFYTCKRTAEKEDK